MLIGIAGPMGCGKTTLANFILEALNDWSSIILPFAAELKRIAKDEFGWDGKKDEKGRRLLQVLGTEAGRAYDEHLWVKLWAQRAEELLTQVQVIVADDLRFENEATYIKDQGGILIKLIGRNEVIGMKHASEVGLPDHWFDHIFDNSGSLEELSKFGWSVAEEIVL